MAGMDRIVEPRSTESLLTRLARIRGTLICAMVVAALDLGFTGSYMFAALVCPTWFVAAVIRTVLRRPSGGVAAARILIPVVMGLLAVGNFYLQATIAMGNAADVIKACERYREANGSYPEQLDQLVPRYLSEVPRAKHCCFEGEFRYWGPHILAGEMAGQTRHAMLVWCEFPPFGRRIYHFETAKWTYLD
jgi:hypothetical protein